MNKTTLCKFIAALALLVLAACGSDGGQYTRTNVIFTVNGPAATIGAIDLTATLPTGFNLRTTTGGVLADGVLTPSPDISADATLAANYTPEDAVFLGQIQVGLIHTTGFAPGDFLILHRTLPEGETSPLSTDFLEDNFVVSDENGAPIAGYTLAITVQDEIVYY